MKSIKLKDYFQLVKPEYVFLKLTPNNSIKNQTTHKIAKSISSLYRNIHQCIKVEETKLVKVLKKEFLIGTKYRFEAAAKVSYYVYMEKKKIEFYFIIPKQFLSLIKEKISDSWDHITITEVETLPSFSDESTKYQMIYAKEDGLSLATDRRNNDLLRSNLNVIDVMEEGDKAGIFYNFIPASQFTWRANYQNTMNKVKRNLPTDKNKAGAGFVLKSMFGILSSLIDDIAELLAGPSTKSKENSINALECLIKALNGAGKISPCTERKATATVLDSQIIVFSESKEKLRQINNARALAQSFESITADNRLAYKPLKKPINFTDYNVGDAGRNKVGDEEAQNFISLAGRELLEKYNFMEKIDTHETQVPEELRKGVFCVGTNTYRGHQQKAYLTEHHEFKNLLLLLIGPTRAGKSNLISHLSIDAIENKECVIIFDFIKKNELSDTVASCFPPEKVLNIEVSDLETIQGMGYNEAQTNSADPFKQYAAAKLQNANLITLINAVKAEGLSPLTSKMKRYLEAAALTVFVNHGAFKDVINCLQDNAERRKWIREIPKVLIEEYMEDYIKTLRELDDYDKDGKLAGTKLSKVEGILDRMNELKINPYIELMLKRDTTNNINLVNEIQKPQLICIRMKGSHFPTPMEKDVLTTYWLTKIMLALEIREEVVPEDERVKVNLVIDELYQVENCEKVLKSKLSQIAKFRCKPIVSCHYINQLSYLRSELRSANTSYMLIAGCDEDNFKELSSDLTPFTYESSLKNMPSYHSLNRIKTKEGYATFITKLPGKVEDRIKEKTDSPSINTSKVSP